jgi:hypothetical protein
LKGPEFPAGASVIDSIANRVVREIVVKAAGLLPASKRVRVRRRARGREDARNLARADFAVVSHGKSGRTWLSVMLSRFFQLRYGLSERSLLIFDNLHRKNRAIPKILFTHDNYIRDYTGAGTGKAAFYDKPTALLVRNPADVAVSQYFQWRHRMLPHKKVLNGYPAHGAEVSIFDFVMHERQGLERVVEFMNEWAKELPRLRTKLIIRYEDMRARPEAELRRLLTWMELTPTDAEVKQAVEFAAFENLKKLEQKRVFWWSGTRMVPGQKGNPDSFKVRRAKVGGYRDYFDDEQVRQIDEYVRTHLDPVYGYDGAATASPVMPELRRAAGA